jgi:hypothetical protein
MAMLTQEIIDQGALEIYKQGMKDALRMFAHWQHGQEYVGTCGTTLKDAIARVDEMKPPCDCVQLI